MANGPQIDHRNPVNGCERTCTNATRSSCATQPGVGNGFAEPRDRQPKSTLSRPRPAAETARPAFEPRKCPQSPRYSSETGKHRFSSEDRYERPDPTGKSK